MGTHRDDIDQIGIYHGFVCFLRGNDAFVCGCKFPKRHHRSRGPFRRCIWLIINMEGVMYVVISLCVSFNVGTTSK